MKDILKTFPYQNLYTSGQILFKTLGVNLQARTAKNLGITAFNLKKTKAIEHLIAANPETYFLGTIDQNTFGRSASSLFSQSDYTETLEQAKNSKYKGIIVIGVHFKNDLKLNRTDLGNLTRAFNQASANLPVILLMQYQQDQKDFLSIAATERGDFKQSWRTGEKIGKIAMLKDIDLLNPHTGHWRILEDMKAQHLNTFEELHLHWQEVFNIEKLNKKFYKKISKWYFWAVDKVKFPQTYPKELAHLTKSDDEYQRLSLIRLLTRILFCWFMKEKGLIPSDLFDKDKLNNYLSNFDGEKEDGNYYQAILQNLFFATLNVEQAERSFVKVFQGKSNSYGDQYVYRHTKEFKKLDDIFKLFKDIPFLNGGLFECLDKIPNEKNNLTGEVRIDGFSETQKKQAYVPNYLFFGTEKMVDISKTTGDTTLYNVEVQNLFDILNQHKFTIEESTPIEQEIALDPLLLGEIFESLLASYSGDETTSKRKQTGSFYTPREVVDYMVNESLEAYLKEQIKMDLNGENIGGFDMNTFENDITILISNLRENPFNDQQSDFITNAIQQCKIIDPACGSGAFPLGILSKMVDILSKLDDGNQKWIDEKIKIKTEPLIKDKMQVEKISYEEAKIAALEKLDKEIDYIKANAIDNAAYDRKLEIIKNCIYGVDIQPIAVQISKLRFFISLIVSQVEEPNKQNRGILPLPNLETKFVAANTLLPFKKSKKLTLFADQNDAVINAKNDLANCRKDVFSTQSHKEKEKLKQKDNDLRKIIETELKKQIEEYCIGLKRNINLDEEEVGLMDNELLKLSAIKNQDKTQQNKVNLLKKNKQIYNRRILKNKLELANQTNLESEASQLVSWNPYNLNEASPFWDLDIMFNIKDGFDIVIGNPPYVRADNPAIASLRENIVNSEYYDTLYEKWDLMVPFYERGMKILKEKGVLAYIASNSITTSKYAERLQDWIIENYTIQSIDYFEKVKVFNAGVVPVITIFRNDKTAITHSKKIIRRDTFNNVEVTLIPLNNKKNLRSKIFKKEFSDLFSPDINAYPLGDICYISYGLRPNSDERFWKGEFSRDDLVSDVQTDIFIKPYVEGKMIDAYEIHTIKYLEWNTDRIPLKLVRPTFPELYEGEKILRGAMNKGTIDNTGVICNHSIVVFKRFIDLKGVDQRSITGSIAKNNLLESEKKAKANVKKYLITIKREKLESVSEDFDLKYLLAVINSTYAMAYLNNFRRHRLENYFYPDDFRNFPMYAATETDQQPFIEKVDKILALKKAKQDTTALEQEIDNMVYKLYDLTYEEVLVVQPDFGSVMSAVEYEVFEI